MKYKLSEDDVKRKLHLSTLDSDEAPNKIASPMDECISINERVISIFNIVNKPDRNPHNMLFFVMYDISSNKVRTLVSKYLIGQGCTRIQCSIFLADLQADKYEKIKVDLAAVQSAYDNNDSIIIVPVPQGYLQCMKIIGQDINIDFITHQANTLFV